MAKECLGKCPRILGLQYLMLDMLAGPHPMHENISQIRSLAQAARDSGGCPGPIETTVPVEKGFFRKRIEKEVRFVCGLEDRVAH